MTIFFTVLGIALGAAAVDPVEGGGGGLGWGAALYLIVTQIIALFVGGFTASRLAGVPRTTAAGLHGAAVWALATVFVAWGAMSGAGAMFGAASTVFQSTARGAADIVQAVAPDDLSFPDLPDIASQVSVEDLPEPVRQALEENNVSLDELRREAGQAFGAVVSERERQRAADLLRSTLSDAINSPGDIAADLNQALDQLVGGPQAIFSEEDWQEATRILEQRLGIERQDAEQVAQTIQTKVEQAVEEVRQSFNDLQEQAVQAIEAAASAVSSVAWGLTITSLLALVAAIGGAFLGKPDGMLGDRIDDRYS
ncbi:hypothetical protein [Marinimicrococcus flavescens]|uniref:PhnA-like protein n=1 Tax=Marinimicrococcus flavescens TaxID=3031815 RepID=A0AAP3XRP9_9PROT|nr:hypothetical protein [Marinimicrococcus flavescens]